MLQETTVKLEKIEFHDEDPVNRLFRATVKLDHLDPKLDPIVQSESLDFSFTNLEDVDSLKQKDPRAGARKPIEEQLDEEEEKKLLAQNEALEAQAAQDEEKEAEEKAMREKKEEVFKDAHVQQSHLLLQTYNQPLNQAKTAIYNIGGRKSEDGKKHKKKIQYECVSLFLNNNQLRSLGGLYDTLGTVMWGHSKLKWIDLSNNYLTTIEDELLKFQDLKTLYLHGNFISEM